MNNDQPQNENPASDAEETRLAAMLRTIEIDAAQPDTARLADIRWRTLDVFDQHAKPSTRPPSPFRLPPSAIRTLIALAATVAVVAVGLNLFSHNSVSGAPFSKVLENLRAAKTLELQVTKDGQASQVWVRAPGLVRVEDSPQQYRIAQGSRLWKIDETANTAAPGDSPWFIDPQHQIDLLGLLEVGVKDAGPLLTAEPAERTDYADRKCVVYRADLPTADRKLRIEAFVDANSNELVAIIANPVDGPRRSAAAGGTAAGGDESAGR